MIESDKLPQLRKEGEAMSEKMTADQVRELITPHLHARPTFDFGRHGAVFVADFQAIADELNATLGAGECEKLPQLSDTVCVVKRKGFEMEWGYWRCSECECENFDGAKYCMNCGRKVKR